MNGLWCGFRQPALLRKNDGRSYVIQWDLSDRYESEMNEKIRPTSDIKDWSSWVPREVLPCAILIIVLPYLVVGPVDMFQPFMNVWTFEVFRWLFVKWLELITYLLYLKKKPSFLSRILWLTWFEQKFEWSFGTKEIRLFLKLLILEIECQ